MRRVPRSPLNRWDVTRGEYCCIIDILNERNIILNALREGLNQVEQSGEDQLERIAQMQPELDDIRRAWESVMARTGARMFEYACHEANYSLPNMLSGYRAAERKPASPLR